MNRAKQLALAMMCGLPPGHDLMRTALADPEAVAHADTVPLEKADLFSLTLDSDSFFEYAEVWDNFEKLCEKLRERGIDIWGSDLRAPAVRGKSPIEMAMTLERPQRVFTPWLWKNKLLEMDDAWYAIENWVAVKNRVNYPRVREAVAAAQGTVLRETRLKAMSITEDDIRSAIRRGKFDDLNRKFAAHGDHLRREDVLLADSAGDHMLDTRMALEHFKELWEELARHGERLEPEDFIFRRGSRQTILKHAQGEKTTLNGIFQPSLWRGRTVDMLKVFNYLPEGARSAVNIEGVLDELTDFDYARKTDFSHIDRTGLTAVLNTEDRGRADFHPVRPLALKSVWGQIGAVTRTLDAQGDRIRMDDLRQTSGLRDETCLAHATRYGAFEQVLNIARAGNETVTLRDLTEKDKGGKSVIDHLIKNDQLRLALQPEDWAGRAPDLTKLWQAIPESSRDKLNFQELIGRTNMLTLRQRFAAPAP